MYECPTGRCTEGKAAHAAPQLRHIAGFLSISILRAANATLCFRFDDLRVQVGQCPGGPESAAPAVVAAPAAALLPDVLSVEPNTPVIVDISGTARRLLDSARALLQSAKVRFRARTKRAIGLLRRGAKSVREVAEIPLNVGEL